MFTRILVCGVAFAISAFLTVFAVILAIMIGSLLMNALSGWFDKMGWWL